MPDATINVGVKVDQSSIDREFGKIPNKIRDQWNKVGQGVAESGVVMGKAFQERLGGRVDRMQQLASEAGTQGFFTPKARREFDSASRDVNTLWKRFTNERIALARDSGSRLEKEIIDLSEREKKARGKEADDLRRQMAQKFKELGDFQATGGSQAAMAKARTDAREMRRALEEIEDEASLVDTKNLPQEPGQPPTPPRGRGAGLGLLGQVGRGLVGAYSVYAIGSMIRSALMNEVQRGTSAADLYPRLGGDMPYEQFRDLTTKAIPSFLPEENTRFLGSYGTAVGRTGNDLARSATEAGQLTRMFGFSPEQGGSLFGQASRLGLVEQGEQGQRRFAKLLAEAIKQGQLGGREAELFESVIRLGDLAMQRAGVSANAGDTFGALARLNATGIPGLQGEYGANVLAGVQQAVSSTSLFQPPQGIKEAIALTAFRGMPLEEIQTRMERADPETIARVLKTGLGMLGNSGITKAMLAQAYHVPLNARNEVFGALSQNASPEQVAEILKKYEADRIEVDIREKVSQAKQKEVELVQKLEPAYEKLLTGVNLVADAFINLHGVIKGKAGESVADWVTGGAAAGTGYGIYRAGKWMMHRGVGAATSTAAEAAGSVAAWRALPSGWMGGLVASLPFWMAGDAPAKVDLSKQPGMLNDWWDKLAHPGARDRRFKDQRAAKFASEISAGARVSGLDPNLIASMVKAESDFDPNAESWKGALGVMQLMPSSFPHMTKADMLDPAKNILQGSQYAAEMIQRYGGDVVKGLAAYNMGPGKLDQYGGKDPNWNPQRLPPGVQDYVSDILMGAGVSAETKNQALNGQIHITLDLKQPDGSMTTTTHTVEATKPHFNFDYRVASEGSGLNARTNSSALTGP